ncbi:MAG: hypothetical protein HOU81_13845 [Hamadaea sp.]|uniref:aa3-type cytochrome oxidase subunit CtaJ n=1 Tax=Hamadaea sp. TaxID=2024425 RepID=UPI0018363C84|nr:hypothetical protein [Hamadaea sp.]NUR71901.1 hypothetical protein [Hamadaea sp.]NUT17961.1 hypothetical protein [Hamadaea sp.]
MDIAQTVLTFVVAPLAVIGVVAVLVFAGSGKSRAKRYRPGRSFDSAPVWFTASAHPTSAHPTSAHPTGDSGEHSQAALPAAGSSASVPAVAATASAPGVTGGASDRW